MFGCLLIGAVSLTVIAAIVALIIIARSDADLMLRFYEEFGQPPESLAGQVIWVTGASSGIGEFLACRLAKAGCRLVLSARRREELERVQEACLRAGEGKLSNDDILVIVLDSVQFESHKDAVKEALDHFNRIDILVNNAGRAQRAAWTDIHLNVDRDLFEVNVLGPISLTQEVLPHMIERKRGHIVVVSSIVGKIGLPNSRSYDGSKFAVQGVFDCLRTEMGQHNIHVTIVCPGPVFSNAFMYAATGTPNESLGRAMASTEKRMSTDRCANLIAIALANKPYECWITRHPWLFLLYICQHFSALGKWLFIKFGTTYLMKMRDVE